MKELVRSAVCKHRIIAILRGVSPDLVVPTAEALYAGGIRMLEITFNQNSSTKLEDTARSIESVSAVMGDKMLVGAGTVMSTEEVDVAYNAGAKFILAPNVNMAVIEAANKKNVAAIPGALTPTEIAAAYEAGATLVKLFPAGNFGMGYIKAILGPINHIPLLAVGGVDEKNLADFLKIGMSGVGIGSNIAKNSLINDGRFDELTELAKLYTNALL